MATLSDTSSRTRLLAGDYLAAFQNHLKAGLLRFPMTRPLRPLYSRAQNLSRMVTLYLQLIHRYEERRTDAPLQTLVQVRVRSKLLQCEDRIQVMPTIIPEPVVLLLVSIYHPYLDLRMLRRDQNRQHHHPRKQRYQIQRIVPNLDQKIVQSERLLLMGSLPPNLVLVQDQNHPHMCLIDHRSLRA